MARFTGRLGDVSPRGDYGFISNQSLRLEAGRAGPRPRGRVFVHIAALGLTNGRLEDGMMISFEPHRDPEHRNKFSALAPILLPRFIGPLCNVREDGSYGFVRLSTIQPVDHDTFDYVEMPADDVFAHVRHLRRSEWKLGNDKMISFCILPSLKHPGKSEAVEIEVIG